jgi:hypothetical protein
MNHKKCLGKTTSSLGMLLVRQEIIAAAYRSTIFKTYLLSFMSQCINVSIELLNQHMIYPEWVQAVFETNLR